MLVTITIVVVNFNFMNQFIIKLIITIVMINFNFHYYFIIVIQFFHTIFRRFFLVCLNLAIINYPIFFFFFSIFFCYKKYTSESLWSVSYSALL